MEMPEGFERLDRDREWRDEDGFTKVFQKDVVKALDLMREMAEALEQIMNEEAPCDESKDEGPIVDYVISINTVAGSVLKKFRSWK